MDSELLQQEKFVFWVRTPPEGLRYVRGVHIPNTKPSALSLANRTVFGWTLGATGQCIRLFYLSCSGGPCGNPDGTAGYFTDAAFRDTEAGLFVGVCKPLGPMRTENSSRELMADERLARRPHAEHWILHFEKQAVEDARLRREKQEADRVAQEAADREAKETADRTAALHRVIQEREAKKAKPRSWFDVLRGRP